MDISLGLLSSLNERREGKPGDNRRPSMFHVDMSCSQPADNVILSTS